MPFLLPHRILLAGCLLCAPFSLAQESQSADELATRPLLKHADDLLKNRKAEEAVPVLEEVLTRLDGLEEKNAVEARAGAQYQLGLCCLQAGLYEKAAATFQQFVLNFPEHESVLEARFLTLESFALQKEPTRLTDYVDELKQSGEFDQLLSVLGRKNDSTRHATLSLVSAYAQTADFSNVQRFLPFCDLDARSDIKLNLALMDGGDLAVDNGNYLDALQFYREVQLSTELMAGYDRRLQTLKGKLDRPLPWVSMAERETQQAQRAAETNRYEQMVIEREHLEKRNYDQALMMRMARCYDQMNRRWNAYAIYHHVYTDFPDSRSAERSRYGAFQCLAALEEMSRAREEAQTYLERYPAGRYRDAITLGLMQIDLKLNDFSAAETLGLTLRAQEPEHRYRDQVTYLLGYIQFEQQNYKAARELFRETASAWPERIYAEESIYWQGMCSLFLGQFADAVAVFEDYLKDPARDPKTMEEDVTYRLGMARYGLAEYDRSRKIFEGFIEKFPESDLRSEAFAMLGDLHGAEGEMELALAYYAQARECAANAEQESYAVFQAVQVYDLQNRPQEIVSLMRDYLAAAGTAGDFAKATRQLCGSLRALGEQANALDARCDALTRFGNSPLEQADMLFADLQDEVNGPLKDVVPAQEILTRFQPVFQTARTDAEQQTLALRLAALFAGISPNPEEYDAFLLSHDDMQMFTPLPLRRFAEIALTRGETEKVEMAFDRFMDRYADSESAQSMVNVQIRSLMAAGRIGEALELAEQTLANGSQDVVAARTHLLAADALRMLKRYDEAVDRYNAFLAVRAWRSSLTPEALYRAGICRMEQGEIEEACAWFQRVYVLYGKYPEWTAKAYAANIECLKKLGRQEDMIRTLREMVDNPDIADTPDVRRAKTELLKREEAAQ